MILNGISRLNDHFRLYAITSIGNWYTINLVEAFKHIRFFNIFKTFLNGL